MALGLLAAIAPGDGWQMKAVRVDAVHPGSVMTIGSHMSGNDQSAGADVMFYVYLAGADGWGGGSGAIAGARLPAGLRRRCPVFVRRGLSRFRLHSHRSLLVAGACDVHSILRPSVELGTVSRGWRGIVQPDGSGDDNDERLFFFSLTSTIDITTYYKVALMMMMIWHGLGQLTIHFVLAGECKSADRVPPTNPGVPAPPRGGRGAFGGVEAMEVGLWPTASQLLDRVRTS
ncbi:hypothetical protein C2845_PM08G27690 [Panicum miliaceum]|uniref:Uncharacterized protein n=1 Tax=Panicum miliaceum TaxID=4540 RepID=A0A3L6QXM3_PANMI|nr:hypothetical protein C2845_PM08G27690 [Panicum miliaceum]